MAGIVILILLISELFIFSVQEKWTTNGKRIQYFSTERPGIIFFDSEYVRYVNITSQRYSRKDPFYYVNIHLDTIVPIGNNFMLHFYFYEFLTNQYKRGFIEMHKPFCDLIHKDTFFGAAMKKYFPPSCPVPKGSYHMYNMTIPIEQVPKGFPFTKGRIYCNVTENGTNKIVLSGYIDMELKYARI
ncbi:uncharacterized protein LOC131851341 [Achroia grisella]|uniref:uncharacterized protein LOC131851341 n=1 Tax=Achroia grisella TaxID=688607 RepID=UPI0027D2CADB|nr:uncharacterized protein LOC131851341 [Achroia grisella]